MLPHFGQGWGMEKAVAQYSISRAMNFSPHCVHLNKVIPLSIAFTPYYISGATMPAHAFPYLSHWDDSHTVLPPSPECWETVYHNICKCIWTFQCLRTTCGDLCCCRPDDMCRCRKSMYVYREIGKLLPAILTVIILSFHGY